jgi:hypothetical protein
MGDTGAEEEREEVRMGWSRPTRPPSVLSMGRGGTGPRRCRPRWCRHRRRKASTVARRRKSGAQGELVGLWRRRRRRVNGGGLARVGGGGGLARVGGNGGLARWSTLAAVVGGSSSTVKKR